MTRSSRTWTVKDGGAALAGELHRELGISHRQAKGLIDSGCVTVNGERPDGHGHRLAAGDLLAVAWDPGTRYHALPPARKLEGEPFKVLWEDEHLLFVDKPAGLLTVPAEKGGEASLAEALVDHYRRRGIKRAPIFIVHRLDRWTSGVLVFAKTPEALRGLKELFEAHRLQRVYHAVLVGELPENSGSLFGKLVEHQKSLKVKVTAGQRGAKHAITHYRVLERLPGHTVVEVKLETGRRNQIRVQFADKGFPLLGDQVYGAESPLIDRQALHAELLGLRHPVTDAQVTVTAKLPEDFEAALKALRNTRRVQRAEAGLQGEEGIFKPTITKEHKAERISRARTHAKAAPKAEGERPRREGFRDGGQERRPRPGGRDPRAGGGPRSQSQGPHSEGRGPRSETRSPRPGSGTPRAESRGPRSESRGPRPESRDPRSESRAPRGESRGPRAEARDARPGPKGPHAEGRGPRREAGASTPAPPARTGSGLKSRAPGRPEGPGGKRSPALRTGAKPRKPRG